MVESSYDTRKSIVAFIERILLQAFTLGQLGTINELTEEIKQGSLHKFKSAQSVSLSLRIPFCIHLYPGMK